jgi:predicted MFS family arabinose efflux permease
MEAGTEHKRSTSIYTLVILTIFVHAAFGGSRVAVSLYALRLNASNLAIGSLMSLYAFLPMLLAVTAGRITDRIGVRPPLLFAAITVSLGLVLPYAWPTLSTLYLAAALIGVGFMAFHVAINYATGTIGEAHQRTHNFSMLAMGFSTSAFIGPMITGFAIDHAGHRNAFLILALLPLVSVAVLMSRRISLPGPHAAGKHRPEHRLMDLLKNQPLRNVFITSGMLSMGWDLFSFMVPIYGAREAGLSASMIGVILAVFASATFSVRLFMRVIARNLREWQVLTLALAITASTYLLFPMFKNPYILMALSFYLGLGLGSAQPMVMTLLHNISPPGRVGEAVGVRTTVMNTSQATMPLLLGALGTAFGMLPVFWAMALLLGGGSWYAGRSAGRKKTDVAATQT